jgi:hypothetical protein
LRYQITRWSYHWDPLNPEAPIPDGWLANVGCYFDEGAIGDVLDGLTAGPTIIMLGKDPNFTYGFAAPKDAVAGGILYPFIDQVIRLTVSGDLEPDVLNAIAIFGASVGRVENFDTEDQFIVESWVFWVNAPRRIIGKDEIPAVVNGQASAQI